MTSKKMFATRLDNNLLKNLKHLSVEAETPLSGLLEEAIKDLLKKHEKLSKLDRKVSHGKVSTDD